MSISNYLFHYTCSLDKIKSILETGFRVSRCTENVSYLQEIGILNNIDWNDALGIIQNSNDSDNQSSDNTDIEKLEMSIPMACFCDISLHDDSVANHRNIYGNYAIALDKSWGIRRGINPVSYLVPETEYSLAIKKLEVLTSEFDKTEPNYDIRNAFFKIVSFLKIYKGEFKKKDFNEDNYRFYDEREWRYIPTGDGIKIAHPSRLSEQEKNFEKYISFDSEDVKCIIVKTEEEKSELREFINNHENLLISGSNQIELKSLGDVKKSN